MNIFICTRSIFYFMYLHMLLMSSQALNFIHFIKIWFCRFSLNCVGLILLKYGLVDFLKIEFKRFYYNLVWEIFFKLKVRPNNQKYGCKAETYVIYINYLTLKTSQCLNWYHHLPRHKTIWSQLVSSVTQAQVNISIGIITYLRTSQYCLNWYQHIPRHNLMSQLVSSSLTQA